MALAVILAGWLTAPGAPALAQKAAVDLAARKAGPITGLPTPRFVSLKADEVNVRRGPGWDHAVAWVFHRAGLPVEVIANSMSGAKCATAKARPDGWPARF